LGSDEHPESSLEAHKGWYGHWRMLFCRDTATQSHDSLKNAAPKVFA